MEQHQLARRKLPELIRQQTQLYIGYVVADSPEVRLFFFPLLS